MSCTGSTGGAARHDRVVPEDVKQPLPASHRRRWAVARSQFGLTPRIRRSASAGFQAEMNPGDFLYLPKWFAHNLPAIHAPLLVLMAYLHARNLMRSHNAP